MSAWLSLIRRDLRDFTAYSSARLEAGVAPVCLNANELPWAGERAWNRYPQQQPPELMDAMAAHYRVHRDQVLATRGSDEGIDLLLRLFCHAGEDKVLVCPPTFGMYQVAAKLQGAQVVTVPLCADTFALDYPALIAEQDRALKLIFLCSPNNPTGNLVPRDQVLSLAQQFAQRALVIVDEAYIEFSAESSIADAIQEQDNLVVLRTFSKAFGLAAARIGALLADAELIRWLRKILPPYPLAQASVEAALHVLQPGSQQTISQRVSDICEQRDALLQDLSALPVVERVWPSAANFLFVKFTLPVVEWCAQRGIIVRDMSARTGIDHAVRITIGTALENRQLLDVLRPL